MTTLSTETVEQWAGSHRLGTSPGRKNPPVNGMRERGGAKGTMAFRGAHADQGLSLTSTYAPAHGSDNPDYVQRP